MNTGGDVADAMARNSIDASVEALKLVGLGAKNLAALLVAVLQEHEREGRTLRGMDSILTLKKQGKPLTTFYLKQEDFEKFKKEAWNMGVLYTPLAATEHTDGLMNIIAKAEDAHNINTIMERLGYDAPGKEDGEKNAASRSPSEKDLTERGNGSPAVIDAATLMHDPQKLLAEPDSYKEFLMYQARQYPYSEKNWDKVFEQRPDAKIVLSRSAWKELGREIKPDAEPIYILQPGPFEDGGKQFAQVKVYDISDTERTGPPEIPQPDGRMLQAYLDQMEQQIPAKISYTLDAPEGGFYDPERRDIQLSPALNDAEKIQALAREGAHARIHDHMKDMYRREAFEYAADCSAIKICAQKGISTDRFRLENHITEVDDPQSFAKVHRAVVEHGTGDISKNKPFQAPKKGAPIFQRTR